MVFRRERFGCIKKIHHGEHGGREVIALDSRLRGNDRRQVETA